MSWVRIDDGFYEHPKLAAVGPIAWGIWLAGLAYCNRNLTDGFIPYAVAESLGGTWRVRVPTDDGREQVWRISRSSGMIGEDMSTEWIIRLLVGAGLWEEVEGGYQVHDYLNYQPSREQVLQEREQARTRMAKAREAKSKKRSEEVRQNFARTSPDVPSNFDGSSRNPNPNPNPYISPPGDHPPLIGQPKRKRKTRDVALEVLKEQTGLDKPASDPQVESWVAYFMQRHPRPGATKLELNEIAAKARSEFSALKAAGATDEQMRRSIDEAPPAALPFHVSQTYRRLFSSGPPARAAPPALPPNLRRPVEEATA